MEVNRETLSLAANLEGRQNSGQVLGGQDGCNYGAGDREDANWQLRHIFPRLSTLSSTTEGHSSVPLSPEALATKRGGLLRLSIARLASTSRFLVSLAEPGVSSHMRRTFFKSRASMGVPEGTTSNIPQCSS